MSGFLNILLNVMNNRQRENEQANRQPYMDAQTKSLELQNSNTEQGINDLNTIRQAGSTASLASMAPGQTADPNAGAMASMRKAIELGRPEAATQYSQVIDLQDKLDEMASRNKAWGGSDQYYQAKSQLQTASTVGKMLNEYHKTGGMPLVKQVVAQNPQLQKIVGDPEKLIFNQDGVMHPALHADTKQPIPGWFYQVDNEGKTKMIEVKPGSDKMDEYTNFIKANKAGGMTDLQAIQAWQDYQITGKKAAATKVATNVNVSNKEQTEEAKAVGKGQGEQYNDIIKGGTAAIKTKNMYDRLGQLLEGVETGKLTPMGTQVAGLAASIGVNIDSKLGNKQAALALGNQLALELRNPAGGAGMPGAMSDKDREFLMSSVPGLSQTPEGNKQMIVYAKAMAQRSSDVAKLATQYRQQHGTLDIGFNDFLQQWSEAHPMFQGGKTVTYSQVGGAKAPKGQQQSGGMKVGRFNVEVH